MREPLARALRAADKKLDQWRNTFGAPIPGDAAVDAGEPSLAFLDTRRVVKAGTLLVAGFVIVFFGWAGLAPLDSAVMAQGTVVVETHRKTIQHLEGGIVSEVKVIEGQEVKAGDVLLRIDDTQAKAQLGLLEGEADALAAQEARLMAERDGAGKINFPAPLTARLSDPKVAEAIEGEQRAFASRRETAIKQVEILQSRKAENVRIRAGLQAQASALETQLALITKESGMIEQLVQRGIEALPRLLQLQRQQADLAGQRGQVTEKMAQITVDTGEIDLQIVNLQNELHSEVLKDLRDVQTKRFDLMERMRAARDVLARTAVLSPDHGHVVSLAVHAPGAVVRPGETLLEIVPQDDQLDVEAHLSPQDIDDVRIGGAARVNLTAYQQYRLPMVTGTVVAVSADRLIDTRTGQPYFNAKVAVHRPSLADYPDVRLVPGMPVEVAIETGSRTMLEYLTEPIRTVMRRGMRES
jgi:HlyD family type I secretion membrane fusion protein